MLAIALWFGGFLGFVALGGLVCQAIDSGMQWLDPGCGAPEGEPAELPDVEKGLVEQDESGV